MDETLLFIVFAFALIAFGTNAEITPEIVAKAEEICAPNGEFVEINQDTLLQYNKVTCANGLTKEFNVEE